MTELIWDARGGAVGAGESIAELCRRAAEETLAYEGKSFDAEVSLLFTDDEEIREINRENRNIDRATDVLSFPMLNGHNGEVDITPADIENGRVILGDIVISVTRARAQAAFQL